MPGNNIKKILGGSIIALVVLMIFGLVWAFVGESGTATSGLVSGSLGWYLFSYAMGLTMIVLPCTLPLAFVIVPMVLKKGAAKGFGLALAFGLGVSITLSLYGLAAAIVGKAAIGSLGAPLETVKNWVYFIAGIFAYLFALGEIGLVKFRMPSYTGAAPAFIQKQGDYFKALLLGLFLGNIGVGCPHPATPLILTEIASSGDLFYGWSLFLVHAIGRVIPLLILAFLALLGVNALQWLVAKKDKLERATGWAMVFVAGFILTLGLFTHDWWVNSGQHTFLESLTQEKVLTSAIAGKLGVANTHTHGLEVGQGLFGLPLDWGNWFMVLLWVIPLFWYYRKLKKQEGADPKLLKQRFWTYIALTAFLVVSFVYYLPTRFLLQAGAPHEHAHTETTTPTTGTSGMGTMDMSMMGHEDHGTSAYHEESEVTTGLGVSFSTSAKPTVGKPTTLKFFVNDRPSGTPVPTYVLEIEHEKLMHVIGTRDDMNGFFHLHPVPTAEPGVFAVDYTFTEPGTYKLWSEVKQGGTVHTIGHAPFVVSGDGVKSAKQVDYGREVTVGDFKVKLNLSEPVVAGAETNFALAVYHADDGHPADLDNYLGVKFHLSIIKDDWSRLIHTHPSDHTHVATFWPFDLLPRALAHGDEEEPMMMPKNNTAEKIEGVPFDVTFPTPGLYRAFAQFKPTNSSLGEDEALMASFWIEVKDEAEAAVPSAAAAPEQVAKTQSRVLAGTGSGVWWVRLIVSLVAIIILSFIIKQLLRVQV